MKLKTFFTITLPVIAGIFVYLFSENYFEKKSEPYDFSKYENQTSEVNVSDTSVTKFSAYSDGYNIYTNSPYGYEIVLLNTLSLNEDIVSVKSRFESDNLVVDVLYDDFTDTLDSVNTYNSYGNKGIRENTEFKITGEYDEIYNGINVHITFYERKSNGLHDKNYYVTAAFERSEIEIVTVFIKSSEAIDVNHIMPVFRFTDKSGEMKPNRYLNPLRRVLVLLRSNFTINILSIIKI